VEEEMNSIKHAGTIIALAVLALIPMALSTRYVVAAEKPAKGMEVKIDNFSFGPPNLTVHAGTEVTWVNRDDIPHSVSSDDMTTFHSRALDTDESWSHKFDKPGTYKYFCSIHPKMTGTVVVE
jgi:plastocyanin